MINLPVSVDEKKQPRQARNQIEPEENLDTDLYSGGFFDGLMGSEPLYPEKSSYWSGYQIGYREYWAGKLSVEIPTQV